MRSIRNPIASVKRRSPSEALNHIGPMASLNLDRRPCHNFSILMRKSDPHPHLRNSAAALDEGNLERTLSEAELAIQADNSLADGFTFQGIALAHLNQKEAATNAFRKALMLDPNRPRHAYNFGAHLFAQGDYWAARKAVSESLKDDPSFGPAKGLLARIDEKQYEGTVLFVAPDVNRPQPEEVEPRPRQTFGFMAGMERPWTFLGWFFVVLGLATAICVVVYNPIPQGMTLPGAKGGVAPLKSGIGPQITVFLMALSGISTLTWILIDIVNKKHKLVWMVPSIALCTCGFHAVPHALYMLMRKME